MIDSKELLTHLKEQGFTLSTGVPCSYFKELFISLESFEGIDYISATREDEAVGIASGYYLGKKDCFVIMQNSGLATIGDALTSLAQLYKIPLLLLVSYRGLEPDANYPEHLLMGDVTEEVLTAYNIPTEMLREENWKDAVERAVKEMKENNNVVCLLVEQGVIV